MIVISSQPLLCGCIWLEERRSVVCFFSRRLVVLFSPYSFGSSSLTYVLNQPFSQVQMALALCASRKWARDFMPMPWPGALVAGGV